MREVNFNKHNSNTTPYETTKHLARQIAKNLIDFADSLGDLNLNREIETLEIPIMNHKNEKPLLLKDVEEYLSCSSSVAYELVRNRKIRSVKIGGKHIVRPEWLHAYIDGLAKESSEV